jgi:hypothetical protein
MRYKKLLVFVFLLALSVVILVNIPFAHATTYTVTAESTNGEGSFTVYDVTTSTGYTGTGSATGTINGGDQVEISVTPPSGTTFSEWISGSTYIYTSSYTFTDSNVNLVFYAYFNVATTVNSAYGIISNPNAVVQQGGSDDVSVSGSPVSLGTGEQAVCTGYTTTSYGSGSGTSVDLTNLQTAQTVTFNWQIQYYLTVNSAYSTTSGSGWYNSGATASFSVTSPASGGSGTQYVFCSWSGSGSGAYNGSINSESITMNNPINETAAWTTQYQITITSSGISTDSSGTVATLGGNVESQSSLPYSEWFNSSTSCSFSFTSPVTSTVTGKEYIWSTTSGLSQTSQSNSFTVTGAGTITGTFTPWYQLTITSPYGSPSGSGWYASGSQPTFSITSPSNIISSESRELFSLWSGSGSGAYSGSSPSASATMNAPITETASWNTQYYVTSSSDANSTITPSAWETAGTSPIFSYSPNAGHNLSNLIVDGVSTSLITYPTSYTFTSISTYHSISVSTSNIIYQIVASNDSHSIISPTGTVYVSYGGSQTFTISANTGYSISTVLVNSVNQGTITSYTFPDVLSNQTISVTSTQNPSTQVNITQIICPITHTGINQNVNLSYYLIYNTNGTGVTSGNITVNEILTSINNGWANFTATNPTVAQINFTVSAVNCGGIVNFVQANNITDVLIPNPLVIFDNLEVTMSSSYNQPTNGATIVISWTIIRQYDGSVVSSFTANVTRDGVAVLNNTSLSSGTDSDSNIAHVYSVSGIIDNTYGITSFTVTPTTVTWSATPSGGGGGGGISSTSPTQTPVITQPTTAPITATLPTSAEYALIAIGCILVGVTFVGAEQQQKRKSKGTSISKLAKGNLPDMSGIEKSFTKAQKTLTKNLSKPSKTLAKMQQKSSIHKVATKIKKKLNKKYKNPLGDY